MSVVSAEDVCGLARGLGFALAGVSPAQPTDHADYIRSWLGEGRHGDMAYLARDVEVRLDPRLVLPGAKSVICVADRYPAEAAGAIDSGASGRAVGRVARYAWGDDYHRVIKKRLFQLADALRERCPGHQFKAAVDTVPLLEREHAQRAGLGWVGKHTLVIHPRLGSWLMLGEVVSTLPIAPPDEAEPPRAPLDAAHASHCGTCTRCIDACPTGCITPYKLDAQRCIGYLTVEHRGLIDPGLHGPMGDWVAGCDVCQEVCPFNDGGRAGLSPEAGVGSGTDTEAGLAFHPRYRPRPPGPAIGLLEILGWDAGARREAFTGSALKRIKLDMLKRNALIAAGNHLAKQDDPELSNRVAELAGSRDEPAMVRETARQVLMRLSGPRV